MTPPITLRLVTIGSAAARLAIDAAEAEARSIGKALTIAVADASGMLIALHRMDGAVGVSVEAAILKARTVILTGVASDLLQRGLNGGDISLLQMPGTVAMGGAIPIVMDGAIVGAIAASGDWVENDVRVAEAGMRAVLAA